LNNEALDRKTQIIFWLYNVLWLGIGIMWGSSLTDAFPSHSDKIWFVGLTIFLFCVGLTLGMVISDE